MDLLLQKKVDRMTEIINSISTVGFPIVMTLLLLYYLREQDKDHKEEMQHITDALNNNNIILAELKEILDNKKKEGV